MAKVAVCFYGNMRNWEYTIRGLLELHGTNCHYFLTTSDIAYDEIGDRDDSIVTDEVIRSIFDGYQLVDHKIYDHEYIANELSGRCIRGSAAPILWRYTIALKNAHELKHNFDYDIVVVIRPDLVIGYYTKHDLTKLKAHKPWILTDDNINSYLASNILGTNDLYLMGTNETIDMLSDTYAYTMAMGLVNSNFYTAENAIPAFLSKYNINSIPLDYHNEFNIPQYPHRGILRTLVDKLIKRGHTDDGDINYTVSKSHIKELCAK